jgi:hypothetical protein
MKSAGSICIALTLLGMLGCAPSVSVNYDYDKNVDFKALNKFAWLAAPATASGSLETVIRSNTILDSRIKAAVNDQMALKGYLLAPDSTQADLLLTYHVGTKDKVDVTNWGYGYGSYGGWYGYGGYGGYGGGGGVDVYQYTEGTLILDIVDVNSRNLVWRGSAQGTLDPNASTEKREQRIKDAVAKMMANYPPPQK